MGREPIEMSYEDDPHWNDAERALASELRRLGFEIRPCTLWSFNIISKSILARNGIDVVLINVEVGHREVRMWGSWRSHLNVSLDLADPDFVDKFTTTITDHVRLVEAMGVEEHEKRDKTK